MTKFLLEMAFQFFFFCKTAIDNTVNILETQ